MRKTFLFFTILVLSSVLLVGQTLQNVQQSNRYRSTQDKTNFIFSTKSAVNTTVDEGTIVSIDKKSSAQLEELGTRYGWSRSNSQLEELGTRYGWSRSNSHLELLGKRYG